MYGYGYSLYNRTPFLGVSGVDPAASAYFAATGITGATQQAAINNLVKGLKADGIWSKMKAVYPFVTDNRNLLSYTTTWVSPWIGGIGTTGQTDPFGGNTAILASGSEIYQGYSYSNSVAYTLSIYAKASVASSFTFGTDISSARFCTFNLSTQTITNNAGYIGSIISVGNGWYRCSVTFTYNVGGSFVPYFDMKPTGGTMYFSSPQLELGSTATTYQPIATTQQAFISNQFKYNLVNPVDSDAAFRLVFNGGWTHSANGATPNGTNGYADTYLIPSTSLTAHNIHLSYYSRTNSAVAASNTMGSSSSEYCRLVVRRTSDIAFNIISDATVGLSQYTVTDSRGLFVANAPSINTRKFYQNGVAKTPVSQTTLGTNGLSTNKIVLAANNNGVILEYDNKQTAFASIGNGLTDTEAANLYTRVQAFQTALSRQV